MLNCLNQCMMNCRNRKRKNSPADIVTILRFPLSAVLLISDPFSAVFISAYIMAGLSDIADGYIARKTCMVSERGALLDSIADLFFISVCLIRFIPILDIDMYILMWLVIIATIRILSFFTGLSKFGKPVMLHTFANKLTGALLFIFPLTVRAVEIRYSAPLICAVASFASVQELVQIKNKLV